jgi:Zn ribbon nucleic-acid-binding protein
VVDGNFRIPIDYAAPDAQWVGCIGQGGADDYPLALVNAIDVMGGAVGDKLAYYVIDSIVSRECVCCGARVDAVMENDHDSVRRYIIDKKQALLPCWGFCANYVRRCSVGYIGNGVDEALKR